MALPCDLEERILKRLALPDRIRLSAVNTSWHSAVTSANERYPPPPQLPWLMLLDPVSTRDHSHKFLNLSENKAYTLQLPHISCQQYFGTGSQGWILAVDKNETSSACLLNPLTGAKISLPSLVTLTGYEFNPKLEFKVLKVEIGWGSGGIAERVLLLFEYAYRRRLAFWRPEEENWLTTTRWEDRFDGIDDILAYKGDFCTVNHVGEVLICRPGEDPHLVPMVDDLLLSHYFRRYLAASLNGELLLVGRVNDYWIGPPFSLRTKRFDIFKLNSSSARSSWEKVETLGRESLFIDNNASICLSVTDCPGWKENCIYFIGDSGRIGRDGINRYNYNDLHIFSLEDGSIKPLRLSIYHPTMVSPIWLPPQTLVLNTDKANNIRHSSLGHYVFAIDQGDPFQPSC